MVAIELEIEISDIEYCRYNANLKQNLNKHLIFHNKLFGTICVQTVV